MTLVLVAAEKPRAEAPGRDAKVCVDELGPSVGATGEDFYPHACLARLERFESLQDAKTAEIRPAPGEVSVSQRQGPEVPKAAGTTVAAPFPGREESAPAPAPAPSPSPPSTLKAAKTSSKLIRLGMQGNRRGDRTCVCRCLQGKLQELQDQRKTRGEAMRPGQSVQATNAGEAPTAATETVPAATAAAGGLRTCGIRAKSTPGDTASGWDSDDDDDWRGTQAAGSPPQVTETPAADAAAKPEARKRLKR
ncbi:hypothetical protein AK812_SmicGene34742 [Symbiodinium microadriaticum]|uniref:Uncharacterized protein n=1 Tax=Symbiodinium microadriaticum TaxID=2951 RepID=A0A1Q9CN80_SYMMI|nr:hypothetical protein AK812_SmicGene34742 [Symbiodinium microadriaticum]